MICCSCKSTIGLCGVEPTGKGPVALEFWDQWVPGPPYSGPAGHHARRAMRSGHSYKGRGEGGRGPIFFGSHASHLISSRRQAKEVGRE
jgi:hypothetical protein